MAPRKIIIDCDPGQDDALMLFMAFAHPDKLDIAGISCVAGNVPLEKTQRNVRILAEIAGRTDVPVFSGCDRPLKNEPLTAEYVHGREGIDGMDIYEPAKQLEDRHGVDFIVDTLSNAADASITLVPTGPLTNIASAIQKEPSILPKIKEVVLMGGAMREGGNITPSAEFNIYVDPHAAQIVFDSGLPIAAFSLDVTHQVFTSPNVLERVRAIGNKAADASHGMLSFFGRYDSQKYGEEGAPLHDPCTIAYLLQPDLFKLKPCNVRVEADSPLTAGHTAVDFWHVTDHAKNTQWAYEVDRDGFFDLLIDSLHKLEPVKS